MLGSRSQAVVRQPPVRIGVIKWSLLRRPQFCNVCRSGDEAGLVSIDGENATGDALDDHPGPGRNTSVGWASFRTDLSLSKLYVIQIGRCRGHVASRRHRQKNFVTIVTRLGLKTGGKLIPWRQRQRR